MRTTTVATITLLISMPLSAVSLSAQTADEKRAATFFENLDVVCNLASAPVRAKLCDPVRKQMKISGVAAPYTPNPVLITTLEEVAKVLLGLEGAVKAATKVFLAPVPTALELPDVIDKAPNAERVSVVIREMSTVPPAGFKNLVGSAGNADKILNLLAARV